MASIPLAALAIQQQPNIADQAGKAVGLLGALQNQRYQAQAQPMELQQRQQAIQASTLENQQRQQQLKDSQVFMDSLQKNSGDFDKALDHAARNGMSGQGYLQYGQQILAHKMEIQKLTSEQLDAQSKIADHIDGQLQGFKALSPEDQATQWPSYRQQILQAAPQLSNIVPQGVPTKDQLNAFDASLLGGKATMANELKQREVAAQETQAQARKTAAEKVPQPTEAGLATTAVGGGPGAATAEAALKRLGQAKLADKTPPDPELKEIHKELMQAQLEKAQEPTADEQRRADLARNMNENLSQIENIVTRRPDLFGPMAGRLTQLRSKVGTSDPDIAKLEAVKEYLGMASVGAHAMRNAQHVETAANAILNNFTNSPDAMKAAIATARSSTETFMQDEMRRKNRALGGGNTAPSTTYSTTAKAPSGATHIVPGRDGKNHYTNAAGTVDLGIAP